MKNLFTIALLLCALAAQGQPKFLSYLQDPWVEEKMRLLSPEERIAQLMMVAAYSHKGPDHLAVLEDLVKNRQVGGLIFFKGGPLRQAKMLNHLQAFAKVPLLCSIDAEWGLSMRLDSTQQYPYQMTLGAIQNDSLIYLMGRQIAEQCRLMGMQVSFSPVVDVNNNPDNPVISFRSFGEDKQLVIKKALAYMRGLEDGLVMANAKHFPGHGDTDTDSHLDMPIIRHSRHRLDSLELFPFKALIEAGVGSMMVAHIHIPALDSTHNTPTTLSFPVVTDLLQKEMGYQGLIFTDALNMKGVAKFYEPGKLSLKALLAGNDALLFAEDVPAIAEIKAAIERGRFLRKK